MSFYEIANTKNIGVSRTEKEKYDLLQKLEGKLSEIELREMYLHVYDNVIILPLAITKFISKKR